MRIKNNKKQKTGRAVFVFFKILLKHQMWHGFNICCFHRGAFFLGKKNEGPWKKRNFFTVNGGADKSKIYKTKMKTTYSFSFHIKSDEKYTKIENNYSRRHGRYSGCGWEGFFFFFIACDISVFAGVIWRRNSVIFWGCLRRPPLGGDPPRPPPRPWCSQRNPCCRP